MNAANRQFFPATLDEVICVTAPDLAISLDELRSIIADFENLIAATELAIIEAEEDPAVDLATMCGLIRFRNENAEIIAHLRDLDTEQEDRAHNG